MDGIGVPATTLDVVKMVLNLGALVLGGWIARKMQQPKDHERAVLLARIAGDAATLVASKYPHAAWPELLQMVVRAVAGAAGVPTTNQAAIERAAASALHALGKRPK